MAAPLSPQPPSPLVQVTATVQRAAAALAPLYHVVHLLSDYLDEFGDVSLPHAASSGSTWLLKRVAARLTQNPQRSPAMLDHWFARAMQIAIEKNDLDMMKTVHVLHPAPLVLKSLDLAMQHGELEMVQWVVAHRCDRVCCAPGVENLCAACVKCAARCLGGRDAIRIVQWLVDEGAPLALADQSEYLSTAFHDALLKSVELLRWYDERGLLSEKVAERLLNRAIANERVDAADAVSKYLVTRGITVQDDVLITALMRGSCQRRKEAVIEVVLASRLCDSFRHNVEYVASRPGGGKVLQWSCEWTSKERNRPLMELMVYYASHFVHIDTVQWLFNTHSLGPIQNAIRQPSGDEELMLYYQWMKANGFGDWTSYHMDVAARSGYLDVVRWLHANSPEPCTLRAMDSAAAGGHLHVVQWLHCNRTEGCTRSAVNDAAANGHLHVVKWLCENRSEHNARDAMINAGRYGHLEVLEWLFHNQPVDCVSCVIHAIATSLYEAGFSVNALKWLEEQPPTPPCIERCNGVFHVVVPPSRGPSGGFAMPGGPFRR